MLNNYIKTYINQMSRRTGTVITDKHMKVLDFAYYYYELNRVGPLYRNIERHTGVTKEEINALFPHGLNSVYTWVGIPIQSTNQACKPVASVHVDDFQEVYFDHNGTTYIRDEVQQVLERYYRGDMGYGNPSSSTLLGKKAFDLVMTARKEIADCLHVKPSEIVFTGSGSEANNFAIKGIAFRYIQNTGSGAKGHIITSPIEHSSVFEAVQFLGMFGYDITFLDVDQNGLINVNDVIDALRSNTILVSIMAVNNEIGTINPIAEIGRVCRLAEVPFMVDGVQAFGKLPLSPKEMGISLLTLTAHKIYGPKGIGAVFVDDSISMVPLIHGGSQEYNMRAGTENIGHIIAFGKAAKYAHAEMDEEMERLTQIRDYFIENLEKKIPGYVINGSLQHRLPTNLNVGFPNVDSGALLISLNKIGVYVSSGSACAAGSKEASPVIKALGVDTNKYGSIRFSFGKQTKRADIDYLFKYLPEIIEQIQINPMD